MFRMSKAKLCLAVAAVALAMIAGPLSAHAQDVSQDSIKALQAQINALQKQLEDVRAAQSEAAAKAAAAAKAPAAPVAKGQQAPGTPEEPGVFNLGRTKVTVGGFMEAAGIYREHNESSDVGSNFNTGIPFNITTTGTGTSIKNITNINSQQSELRGSARQSRVTVLAEANATDTTKISAYAEADFLGAAQTANSNESNSYTPRMRVVYGTIDMNDCGLHVLAGQEWSLLTTNRVGMIPRQENIPLTIDAQYVPGFNWTRNPQLRVSEEFCDHRVWLGLSVESPQAILGGITAPGFVTATEPAGSGGLFNSANSYTTDYAPDVIAKAAFDPGWGHYEAFGITRFFHDYILAGQSGLPAGTVAGDHSAVGFGGGTAAILPICPGKLDFQANFMAGQGIGRYGSCQLPDFAFTSTGEIKPLTEYTALVGVVAHPEKTWDIYAYGGYEGVQRANYANLTTVGAYTNVNYGYGDFDIITGQEQSQDVWQVTAGFWKRIYQGPWGKVQIGLQDSVTRRDAFSISAGPTQHAWENIIMTSFRFYPL